MPRGPWGERLARAVAAVSIATWPGDAAAGETGQTSSSLRNDVPPHRRAAEALSQVMAVGAGAQKAQNSSEVSSTLALFFFFTVKKFVELKDSPSGLRSKGKMCLFSSENTNYKFLKSPEQQPSL